MRSMQELAERVLTGTSRASLETRLAQILKEIQEEKILTAKSLVWQLRSCGLLKCLKEAEFKVFSQFGDDGIIQYLIHRVELSSNRFVEFGIENYAEANTRFLLLNDNWTGLVFDGDADNIEAVKREGLYWRYDLAAVEAFIDRDNINRLLNDNGMSGEIGILSIDIDGNDYWVWEEITTVQPTLVIAEYNSVFGSRRAVSIPYDPTFRRRNSHHSTLYWGCSIKALCILAERKGYAFIGCNSNGNNAYFVRKERLGTLSAVSVEDGYEISKFRESRDPQGNLTYLSGTRRLKAIDDMPVVDVETGATMRIRDMDIMP